MTGAVWLRVRGLFPCLHQEGVEAYSLPLAGVGSLVLSVTMEVLGEKPTGRLFRAGFLVPQVGSVLKEQLEYQNQMCRGTSTASSCPRSRFLEVHTSSLKRRKASLWMC